MAVACANSAGLFVAKKGADDMLWGWVERYLIRSGITQLERLGKVLED